MFGNGFFKNLTVGGNTRIGGQLSIDGMSRVLVDKNNAQTFTDNIWEVVEYDDKTEDNLGEYDSTTWTFTASKAGFYLVCARLLTANAAWTAGDRTEMELRVNQTTVSFLVRYEFVAATTDYFFFCGSDIVEIAAGDDIDIRVIILRGANTTSFANKTFNRLAIHKLS